MNENKSDWKMNIPLRFSPQHISTRLKRKKKDKISERSCGTSYTVKLHVLISDATFAISGTQFPSGIR